MVQNELMKLRYDFNLLGILPEKFTIEEIKFSYSD